MTAIDMLANWPGWETKTPEDFLTSPAWSMMVRYGDDEMRLRLTSNPPRDVIGLRIAFDGEEHFLGLGNREIFPDLSALWNEKRRLPDALLLALIEKECGNLLQLLENAVRSQLTVIGLAKPEARDGAQGFEVVSAKGNKLLLTFSLSLSHRVKSVFGDVAHIDTAHPEIRALEMPSLIQYAAFELNEDEAAALTPGDYLLLPETTNLASARWLPQGIPNDGRYYVLAAEPAPLTFGNLTDGALPPIPEPDQLVLARNGRTLAAGHFCMLGRQRAFALEEIL